MSEALLQKVIIIGAICILIIACILVGLRLP